MIRQLNVKRQLTIPAPLAIHLGLGSKGWVDVAEKAGVLVITPMHLEAEGAKPLDLSERDWQAFNRKVRQELKAGKGTVHASPDAFLQDLKRRMRG